MTFTESFRPVEKRQDLFLGVAFLLITGFSSIRIIRNFSPTGGRKVITTFNILIFMASSIRAVWFLLPNDLLETSYTPQPLVAFQDYGWIGAFFSELMLSTGSMCLYGIFILVACYWVNMLQKLNTNTVTVPRSGLERFKVNNLGTMEVFGIIMGIFVLLEGINICLFLTGFFNSEQMILYDAIMLSVVSVAVITEITILSSQIQSVLQNLEAINNRNSQPQIRRIFAIILVANVFFVTRVILECTVAVYLVQLMKDHRSFSVIVNDKFWSTYILAKHLCEVIVLTLELFISTAIKSYDTRRTASGDVTQSSESGRSGSVGVVIGSGAGMRSYGATLTSNYNSNHYGGAGASGGVGERGGGGGGLRQVEMADGVSEATPMLQPPQLYARAGANEV